MQGVTEKPFCMFMASWGISPEASLALVAVTLFEMSGFLWKATQLNSSELSNAYKVLLTNNLGLVLNCELVI